ncbi:hypothetical protein [Clostridium sp.]|uniref:hypothetical protein n=1 Tax=Clostridium sp. TaxID=1506 RepID=UPI0025C50F00|nr:hypothetical protein [Clostridium sp.]
MYKYRKHLRGSFLNYCVGLIIFFSFIFLGVFGAILSEGEKLKNIDFVLIVYIIVGMFVLILLEFTLLYFLLLKRFKYINVTLTDDAIIYINKNKKKIIPYDEIKQIRYPSIKYTGGWMEVKYNGGKIRLTVVLEKIGEFMYQLKEILDERGKSNVYNEKKSFSFFKTASFSDESWDRLYKNIKYIIIMEYVSLLTTIILAFFGMIQYSGFAIIVGIFAPIIGYIFTEIIIGIRVSKRVVDGEFKLIARDSNKEKKMMKVSIATSVIICAFIMIFIS